MILLKKNLSSISGNIFCLVLETPCVLTTASYSSHQSIFKKVLILIILKEVKESYKIYYQTVKDH